jgi:hypothetical protein
MVGPSKSILDISVGFDNRSQDSLAVMKTVSTFEQNSLGFGDTLFAVVNETFVPICNPHGSLAINTSK